MGDLWRNGDRMTQKKWLGDDAPSQPYQMLHYLSEQGVPRRRHGRRKLRLLACACVRRLGPILTEAQHELVQVAERLADELVSKEEQRAAAAAAALVPWTRGNYTEACAVLAVKALFQPAADAVRDALVHTFGAYARDPQTPDCVDWKRGRELELYQHGLFREIFGNPFRPVVLRPDWSGPNGAAKHLAQSIYQDRRFDELPILADALEEAGCDNAAILEHCRSQTEHVRGCWAVDLILAKT
jgi:hypothetical protein